MKLPPLVSIWLLLVPAAFAQDESARLRKIFEEDHAWNMHEFPEAATFGGYAGENDRWASVTRESIERWRQHPAANLKALDGIDRAKLGADDQLNYDLFRAQTLREIEGLRFHAEYLRVGPMGGVHSEVPSVLEHQPTRTLKDYEDAIKRLQGVPELVDENIALLREGLAKGITQPKIVIRGLPAQVDRILQAAPADSVLMKIFQHFPDSIEPADRERLKREAASLVDGKVYPAYRKFRDFLASEYIPGSRDTIGLSALPDGAAWYQYRTHVETTTNLTPREIHEIGLSEVKRIRAAMEKTVQETGFQGSFDEFVHFLRTDPRFYYTRAEDLVTGYRDICKRTDAELPKLFGKLPRTPYGVKEMDAYYAPTQTTAFYEPGPVDGSASGTYRVNTYKLDSRPKYEMEVLSMHESVPGHHLQIALAHEMGEQPEFRKDAGETAFVEGWGLYSESLGYEMGFYKDPYSKFGQLSYEMWRACRLVVDTGMHVMGWTRQQSIDFMQSNTALTEQNIVAEVDRYISWPGQATAYKIGQLKIRGLRTEAEQKLGAKFDERKFHDAVLGAGAIPLDVLEQRVHAWMATQ